MKHYSTPGSTALSTEQILSPFSADNPILPSEISHFQNYPNPFNPTTTTDYQLLKRSFVTTKVFDILGREVRSLIGEIKDPGTYSISFNASSLASGLYFYQLQSGDFVAVRKMLLRK